VREAVLDLQRDHRKGRLAPEKIAALQSLSGWTWCETDRRRRGVTARPIRALMAFVEGGGQCGAIPSHERLDGVDLTRAVTALRARYRRGELATEAIAVLEALPGWSWASPLPKSTTASPEYGQAGGRRSEESVFALIERFVAREQHARVPRFHVEDGFRLGSWLHVQRLKRRRGLVSDARARRLESLPGWTWEIASFRKAAKRQLATPDGVLAALREHVRGGGSAAAVDTNTRWHDVPLQPALDEVRRRHALRELPDRLVRGFEKVPGWDWTPSDWLGRRFFALRAYADRCGHARVPRNHREGDVPLGQWMYTVRSRHRRGALPEAQVRLLEGVPGWSWGRRSPGRRQSRPASSGSTSQA
jgi:Helicase associated domain